MSEARPGAPRVFISSTSEDLGPFRARASAAATAAGLLPVMMEHFTATGARRPFGECLARVRECNVLVVLVAHRYGWKPDEGQGKSITWLECEEALSAGQEVLAFLVDEKYEWPLDLKDSHRMAAALENGSATAELMEEVRQDIAGLRDLKKWLDGLGVRSAFTTPDDLHRKVESALRDWRQRHPEWTQTADWRPSADGDPTEYLNQLREQCAWIDIRGLQVGTGRAHRFPIEDLYIPLAMSGAQDSRGRDAVERRAVPLEEALAHARLVVVGDPGSGKTTFLRHVALGRVNDFVARPSEARFPVFVRISELLTHIRKRPGSPLSDDSPRWLVDLLASRSEELNQGLSARYFRERLERGPAIVLLDGLDEAATIGERETAVRLFESATKAYRHCRFVVTTRPSSYTGRGVLGGFETAHIEPLEPPAIETFLERWCSGLFPDSAASAMRHLGELTEALRGVPEIRRMARNPVMLTALAVVHWVEHRLPEQRADLYESVVNWLARSREKREGRESAERCLQLLQQLALAMQSDSKGRQVQVEKGQAADVLAERFEGPAEAARREHAMRFVE